MLRWVRTCCLRTWKECCCEKIAGYFWIVCCKMFTLQRWRVLVPIDLWILILNDENSIRFEMNTKRFLYLVRWILNRSGEGTLRCKWNGTNWIKPPFDQESIRKVRRMKKKNSSIGGRDELRRRLRNRLSFAVRIGQRWQSYLIVFLHFREICLVNSNQEGFS